MKSIFAFFLFLSCVALPLAGCRRSESAPSLNRTKGDLQATAAVAENQPVVRAEFDAASKPREIQFSGYDWIVKTSNGRVGPGPNRFSDSEESVRVDDQGRLHLHILQRDGAWYCSEVISKRSFGTGTYRYTVQTNIDSMDPNIVLGLFTWSDSASYFHRELDIEISRWGKSNNENCQFVLTPYKPHSEIKRFMISPGLDATTHIFVWKPDSVFWQSLKGSSAETTDPGAVICQHTFDRNIPQPGGENARCNLWLLGGLPPKNGKNYEVVLSKFEYLPLR